MPGAYFRPRRWRARRPARLRAALRSADSAYVLHMGRRGDRRVVVRWFRLVSACRARASHLAYRLAGQESSGRSDVAHYFSLFFLGGQYVIPLLSDPLGRGWNLYGTAQYQVGYRLVTPRLQWSVAVVAVVLGHVCAIYLSHVTALRLFADRRAALRSQIPMVALMVTYTMLSLWILSQPIVETGVR